jgi:hypothetical protein
MSSLALSGSWPQADVRAPPANARPRGVKPRSRFDRVTSACIQSAKSHPCSFISRQAGTALASELCSVDEADVTATLNLAPTSHCGVGAHAGKSEFSHINSVHAQSSQRALPLHRSGHEFVGAAPVNQMPLVSNGRYKLHHKPESGKSGRRITYLLRMLAKLVSR